MIQMMKSLTNYKPIDILKTLRGLELIIGQPNDDRHNNFQQYKYLCIFQGDLI